MSHQEHHNLHVVCRFKSCELQLIEFVSHIVNNSCTKQTDVIILDFSKTFDYVPQNRLLYGSLDTRGQFFLKSKPQIIH